MHKLQWDRWGRASTARATILRCGISLSVYHTGAKPQGVDMRWCVTSMCLRKGTIRGDAIPCTTSNIVRSFLFSLSSSDVFTLLLNGFHTGAKPQNMEFCNLVGCTPSCRRHLPIWRHWPIAVTVSTIWAQFHHRNSIFTAFKSKVLLDHVTHTHTHRQKASQHEKSHLITLLLYTTKTCTAYLHRFGKRKARTYKVPKAGRRRPILEFVEHRCFRYMI